ncbi:MAG: PhzF family phenazine biosynthesis protein [Candidatus Eisenbacteria bacterium]|nr:PhzF family phenazine biosynthesis protein [Candidatus Eisenbacteria bacterium]
MRIPIYQVDAFASEVFSGNPAAVCFLDAWLSDRELQSIAAENNLSETAFLVRSDDGFDLRWFTPVTEVSLCGHATLASAFVLFECLKWKEEAIRFRTRKSGQLVVTKREDLLEMDFPARPVHPMNSPAGLLEALKVQAQEVLGSAEDTLVVLDSETSVRELRPDFTALGEIECRGVIVTARGDRSDFVSRFFAPRVGIAEDPVTGSAHCVLIPYWARILGKKSLHALQVSRRGGELFCEDCGERVRIAGRAVLYLEGTISV